MFTQRLELLVVVERGSTVNVPHRTNERFASASKFFRDAVHGKKIKIIYRIFYDLMRWSIREFVWLIPHVMLHFPRFSTFNILR